MADRTDPADFPASSTLGSSQLNELARGEINCVKQTSNSAGTGSTEVVLSDTVVLTDDRRIRIYYTVTCRTDIAGGIQARIDFDGTQWQRKNIDTWEPGKDLFITSFSSQNVSAGSYTVELITGVSGGAGNTVTAIANGATGTHGIGVLSVDDVGPWIT